MIANYFLSPFFLYKQVLVGENDHIIGKDRVNDWMALLAKRQHLTDQDFIAELELSDLHCHLGFAADYQTL